MTAILLWDIPRTGIDTMPIILSCPNLEVHTPIVSYQIYPHGSNFPLCSTSRCVPAAFPLHSRCIAKGVRVHFLLTGFSIRMGFIMQTARQLGIEVIHMFCNG